MKYIIKIDGEVLAVARDKRSAERFLRSVLVRSAKVVVPVSEGQKFTLGRYRQDTKKIISISLEKTGGKNAKNKN